MRKYSDIVRLGHKSTLDVLQVGDYISISEKLDGSNASLKLNDNQDGTDGFSRNTIVDENNTLRGFYQWIKDNINHNLLNPDYTYYGEFLASHKIKYKPEYYVNFYLFSVYDIKTDEYLSDEVVKSEANRINIKTVPYFYEGEYISYEHLLSFVGQSDMAIDKGEGIVVKNVKYKNKYGRQLFVKLVTEEFAEIQKQRLPKDPNRELTIEQEFVNTCLTKARVDKMLYKLVDEGIIEQDYDIEEMGIILRNMGNRMYEDIMKEESDLLPEGYDIQLLRKAIGSRLPKIIKDIIVSR